MTQDCVRITVQVQPNSRRNEVLGFADGVLQVRIAAPPLKGKANRELTAFLSQLLDISKGNILLERGERSRTKVIAIKELTEAEILERLHGVRP